MKAIAKRSMCVLAVFAVVFAFTPCGGGYCLADEASSAGIVYPALRLEYDKAGKPSKTMSQALPLGNGYMGANIYGGVKRDEIQINEHTLWSGGPGASAAFDGGINDLDAATVRESLQTVRRGLQDEMTEFSASKAAYKDDDGNVVTNDYSANAQYISQAIENLKGEKTNFGSYQTFGSFITEDADGLSNRVNAVASNELATQADQKANSLFDGNIDTKWYSLAGTPAGTVQPMPCRAAVQYRDPVTFDVYTVVSGNDVPERDPKHWKLYGSDDGQNWTLIDERDGITFAQRKTAYKFTLDAPVTYEYLKFETIENASGNGTDGVQASELIFGDPDDDGNASEYLRVLDLDSGVASVDYVSDETHFRASISSAIRTTWRQCGSPTTSPCRCREG